MPLDFTKYFGDKAAIKFFALMVGQLDEAYLDFSTALLHFIDMDLPLEMFGLSPDVLYVEIPYTLQSTYERPNGKFALGL